MVAETAVISLVIAAKKAYPSGAAITEVQHTVMRHVAGEKKGTKTKRDRLQKDKSMRKDKHLFSK